MTYGLTAGMDVQASDVRLDWPHGTRFTLHAHGATREMRLKGLGRAMIAPALAAVAVATNEGRSLDDAVAALEELMPLPGRLQLVELADGIRMIRDDQKVSVETIHAAFDVLAEIPGRRMLGLGESPKWTDSLDPAYRELGKRMAEILDAVVFVGANNERLAAYASEAGMPKDALHRVEPGVHTIVAALRELMRPGDTILLKGYIYQRLERVALALQGQTIGCGLVHCELPCPWGCATCPVLATGWNQRRVLR